MKYTVKDKKNINFSQKKKRINWSQSLKKPSSKPLKGTKVKKSLQYLFLINKYHNLIDYKNIKLLKAFLTKYGKIRSRRKTRIKVQFQKLIAKAIRKARSFGLLPFTCDVKI